MFFSMYNIYINNTGNIYIYIYIDILNLYIKHVLLNIV